MSKSPLWISIVLSMSVLLVKPAEAQAMLGEMMYTLAAYCPVDWLACEGQLLPISQYEPLFGLYGNSFGGDGRTTFGVPDCRGRVTIGKGSGPGLTQRTLGQRLGSEWVTLNAAQMPSHTHTCAIPFTEALGVFSDASLGTRLATDGEQMFSVDHHGGVGADTAAIHAGTTGTAGADQPHANMSPYVSVLGCIHTRRSVTSNYAQYGKRRPFLGEVRQFAGAVAPDHWAFATGQYLAISQHMQLFGITGNSWGGDGRTTFALPDLRGRVPLHPGSGPGLSTYAKAQRGGAEEETLGAAQMPTHEHTETLREHAVSVEGITRRAALIDDDDDAEAKEEWLHMGVRHQGYADEEAADQRMEPPHSTGAEGAGEPHENVQPTITINFIVAMQGQIPRRLSTDVRTGE